MKTDVRKLAIEYIDEVIADQRELGYTSEAAPEARAEAEKHAESALGDLATSSCKPQVRAVAA